MQIDPARKISFLSLEFIIGENTYWLTSGKNQIYPWVFTVIPISCFEGLSLSPENKLFEEANYSSIWKFEDGQEEKTFFSELEDETEPVAFQYDPQSFPVLSWNEMAEFALNVDLDSALKLYHRQMVRMKKDSDFGDFKPNDVDYLVTGFSPEFDNFTVWGSDYKQPDNPNAITFQTTGIENFKETIKKFYIKAVNFGGEYYLVTPEKIEE